MKKKAFCIALIIASIRLEAQNFYTTEIASGPQLTKTFVHDFAGCTKQEIFTCSGISFWSDIAVDTSQNIYFGVANGQLYKRNLNDNSSCEYLGTFGNSINALVADIDGNLYAVGQSSAGITQLYKYEAMSHAFITIGDFPTGMASAGDLFFYNGKLFLVGPCQAQSHLIQVNISNPTLSCCFGNFVIPGSPYGAFSIYYPLLSLSRAFIVSSAFNGSNFSNYVYEVLLDQGILVGPVCNFSGSQPVQGAASVYDFSPSVLPFMCSSLPVGLLNFNSEIRNKSVRLYWETTYEFNNDYFIIEKSTDAINFKEIGKVKGSFNSNSLNQYEFYDDLPSSINYYRLKQVDLDRNFTYSKVELVKFSFNNYIQVLQNPFNGNLRVKIQLDQELLGELRLFDLSGRLLSIVKVQNGINYIDTKFLSVGTYILKLLSNKNVIAATKVIKAAQ